MCCTVRTKDCKKEENRAWSIFSIEAAPVMQACLLAEGLLLLHARFKQAFVIAAHMKSLEQKYLHLWKRQTESVQER